MQITQRTEHKYVPRVKENAHRLGVNDILPRHLNEQQQFVGSSLWWQFGTFQISYCRL